MKLKTLVLVCVGMHLIGVSSASATIGISPDFRDYAIVATNDVELQSYSVIKGDVFAADDLTLEFGYGIQRPAMNMGSMYAGGDVVINLLCDVNGNVIAGGSIAPFTSVDVTGTVEEFSPAIPAMTLPAATPFVAGALNISDNDGFTLLPGSYGNVVYTGLFDNIYLSSGNYYLNSLELQNSCDLHLDLANGPIKVFIKDDFTVERYMDVFVNGVEINESTPVSISQLASQVLFEVHGDAEVDAGPIGAFFGTIFAPYSGVDLIARDMYGSIIANGSVNAETYLTHRPSQFLAVPEPDAMLLLASAVAIGGIAHKRGRQLE